MRAGFCLRDPGDTGAQRVSWARVCSAAVSACVAGRMVGRLSLGQLNKLNGLGKLRKRQPGDVTFKEFVQQTRSLQDPEIVGVVTSSGLVCAVTN